MHSFTAIRGKFGKLAMYALMIRPEDITELVGHDPRGWINKTLPKKITELYEMVQRVSKRSDLVALEAYAANYSHREAIGIGAFPALSVGLVTAPKFEPYVLKGIDPDCGDVGLLKLKIGKGEALYLDGCKRACAILNKFDEGALGLVYVPITIFAPQPGESDLGDQELGQIFSDFNTKAIAVKASLGYERDTRDPYIALANTIADSGIIKSNGGVDRKRDSLGGKSTNVATLKDLVVFVKGAVDGETAVEHQKKMPEQTLDEKNRPEYERLIPIFLGGMVDGMTRDTFRDRTHHLHLLAPVWAALGVVFHDLHTKLAIRDDAQLVDYGRQVGSLDWGRSAPRLKNLLRGTISGKQSPWSGSTAITRRALTPQLRAELGIEAQVTAWTENRGAVIATAAE
jgi:hypothetical protein